jgi:hypothetical protein
MFFPGKRKINQLPLNNLRRKVSISEIMVMKTICFCSQVVKVFDFFKHFPLTAMSSSQQGLWILSCVETIHLAYGTLVVLLGCLFVPEVMHGKAPEVFLHQ